MDLSEFVDETLSEILKGIRAAQAKTPDGLNVNAAAASIPQGSHNVVNDSYGAFTIVDFDVSVLVETKGGGKGSLRVFSVGIEGEAGRSMAQTSRIKFSVPLRLPEGDTSRKDRARSNFNRPLPSGSAWTA